ncbi:glycosyl transferase family 2 [Halothece sp. PCC 7418]|uniref:glycosyltransferase family 2 protein n=1 Tax=Halothece sp. (strain PCC 7418) TaxID=65093 RepID=UPI0002A0877C|nr:glycosyltransferase [Halothece sp. PCC 7418]AFZ45413.1 glycosyl transferase family 2 [Halothece sp. PCC 7418]
MPKVSVIIPTYNGSRYICQTIESVFNQSYLDWEVIVVDDGSTDATREILTPYRDRVDYYYQTNQGVAAARNFGLTMAQGDYINFLDHDDILLTDKLALQVEVLEQRPQVGMVHSGWKRINSWGEPLANVEPWHQAPTLDLHEWLQWMPVLFSPMLFRWEWLNRVGPLDTTFQQACDVDLIQRLAIAGCQTAWIRQVTTCYREHSRNDSLNTLIQAQESWQVRQKFFTRPDLPLVVRERQNQYLYHTLVWIAWRLYYTNHLSKMGETLEQSLQYSPYPYLETVFNWVELFKAQAAQQTTELDLVALTASREWQKLLEVARQEATQRRFQQSLAVR